MYSHDFFSFNGVENQLEQDIFKSSKVYSVL